MIHLFLPVMRPKVAQKVIENLNNQTRKIDLLTIVDNGGNFDLSRIAHIDFDIDFHRPQQNIGTNAVWNMMWDSKADYIGIIGDDCEVEEVAVQGLIDVLDSNSNVNATTATVFRDKPIQFKTRTIGQWRFGKVAARGRCGLVIFKASAFPKMERIPSDLFIFFGDNWIGAQLVKIGPPLQEVNVGLSHYRRVDLKRKLNYPDVLRREHKIWSKLRMEGKI